MSATTTPTARDQIINDARSMPDLIAKAQVADPALAKALTGEAQQASATPIGGVVTGIVALLVSRYGLGWDQGTCEIVAGLFVLGGGYAVHWFQAWRAKVALAPAATPSQP